MAGLLEELDGDEVTIDLAHTGAGSPHPQALANQGKKTRTDEHAVMLDGPNPIHVLAAGEPVEWQDYWKSWMETK